MKPAKDGVFTIAQGEFQIVLNGKVHSAIWNSRGAALAGLKVEKRRAEKKAALEGAK